MPYHRTREHGVERTYKSSSTFKEMVEAYGDSYIGECSPSGLLIRVNTPVKVAEAVSLLAKEIDKYGIKHVWETLHGTGDATLDSRPQAWDKTRSRNASFTEPSTVVVVTSEQSPSDYKCAKPVLRCPPPKPDDTLTSRMSTCIDTLFPDAPAYLKGTVLTQLAKLPVQDLDAYYSMNTQYGGIRIMRKPTHEVLVDIDYTPTNAIKVRLHEPDSYEFHITPLDAGRVGNEDLEIDWKSIKTTPDVFPCIVKELTPQGDTMESSSSEEVSRVCAGVVTPEQVGIYTPQQSMEERLATEVVPEWLKTLTRDLSPMDFSRKKPTSLGGLIVPIYLDPDNPNPLMILEDNPDARMTETTKSWTKYLTKRQLVSLDGWVDHTLDSFPEDQADLLDAQYRASRKFIKSALKSIFLDSVDPGVGPELWVDKAELNKVSVHMKQDGDWRLLYRVALTDKGVLIEV